MMDEELFLWFEREGMLRYRIESDEHGEVTEEIRAPAIALGPRDQDWVWTPHPGRQHYPFLTLDQMTLDDFNDYLYRYLEEAVRHGALRCAQCGKVLIDDDDLPDADTWDAILIEKELVGWLAVHFDCKKQLPKRLKGLHPFELTPAMPPLYDLSNVPAPTRPDATGDSPDSAGDSPGETSIQKPDWPGRATLGSNPDDV